MAYRTLITSKIERYRGKFLLSYGEKIKFGAGLDIDYYKVKDLNIEFYEAIPSVSGSYKTTYGNFLGSYNLKNEWTIGYEYGFCFERIKYGFGILTQSEENLIVLISTYLSTLQDDIKISFLYRKGIKFDVAYPISIGISKNYKKITLELSFTPSDIATSCFDIKIYYYFK